MNSWRRKTAIQVKNIPSNADEEEIMLRFEGRSYWGRELDVKQVVSEEFSDVTYVIFNDEQGGFGSSKALVLLPPSNEVCEGNVFTGVKEGDLFPGGSLSRGSLSRRSLSGRPPCVVRGRWYVSNWNAFLLFVLLSLSTAVLTIADLNTSVNVHCRTKSVFGIFCLKYTSRE